MLGIHEAVPDRYVAQFIKNKFPSALFAECRKWLRYFIDFCNKYFGRTDSSGLHVVTGKVVRTLIDLRCKTQ
jgi:hypothetical protein